MFERILHLQSRIDNFELFKAGQELIKEGELVKMSRNKEDERYFILLSDCLLFCHYYGALAYDSDRFLTVKYNIPIQQIRVSVVNAETFPTEFSITSKVRGFTVRAK